MDNPQLYQDSLNLKIKIFNERAITSRINCKNCVIECEMTGFDSHYNNEVDVER